VRRVIHKLTGASKQQMQFAFCRAKQKCVMGVGMCLYAQLVQTKNTQCKSAIILQCYHPHLSDFCSRVPTPVNSTWHYNHIIFWCCQNLSSLLNESVCCIAYIAISGKLFHTFWVQKKIFLNHSHIYYNTNFRLWPLVILSWCFFRYKFTLLSWWKIRISGARPNSPIP